VKNNHIAHPNKMCIHTNKENKTRKKPHIAFGNAKKKPKKKNQKQITKAFLNAFPQIHKTKQNQNIPNQTKTTNKAFLNTLIHKYKQKIKIIKTHQHQQNPNIPNQTTNYHTKTANPCYNTHNTKTTIHPKIIPTTHTNKTNIIITKTHQNTHQKKEETLQKPTKARPTGLAQRKNKCLNKKKKNSNKTTHQQTYITNHRRPITHTTKATIHPKLTKPTPNLKKHNAMTTKTQNTHQKQKSKNKESKMKKTRNIPISVGKTKVIKQHTKQHTTKTISNASAQVYQIKQKQITPNQPKATNKTLLNTLTHKYKLKQQKHPKQPNNNQTRKPHLNTHNTNTTKYPIIQPTIHIKKYKTTPEKHQNTHPKEEGKKTYTKYKLNTQKQKNNKIKIQTK
jgi:hypothetical protein